MDTYEVLTLLFLGGTFLIALLAYLDNRNNKRKGGNSIIPEVNPPCGRLLFLSKI